MARPAPGLVLLAACLAAGSPLHRRELGAIKELAMDMAPDSFDDQYRGCRRAMEEELPELNRTEFADNSIYAKAWTMASAKWHSQHGHVPPKPALRPELAVALLAYTQNSPLYQEFNAAVRVAGHSRAQYLWEFDFKVLHFLLSEALRALRDAAPRRCHRVYRGVQGIRFTARPRQPVRFGHFTSTTLQKIQTLPFGQDTLFSIETCYGVPIRDFSFFPDEEEVLIPPYESFEVLNASQSRDRATIELRSLAANSTYNCELVKEKRCQSLPCVFDAGRSIPGDPLHLWVLLLTGAALAAAWGP